MTSVARLCLFATLSLFAGCVKGECDVGFCVDDSPSNTPRPSSEPAPDGPVAECDVDASELDLGDATFTFTSAGSYSPDGLEIVAFEWELRDSPADGSAGLSAERGEDTLLDADAVGTYEVELNVVDELGIRSDDPCVQTVEVVRDE